MDDKVEEVWNITSYWVVRLAVLNNTRTCRNASGGLGEIRRVRRLLDIACCRARTRLRSGRPRL